MTANHIMTCCCLAVVVDNSNASGYDATYLPIHTLMLSIWAFGARRIASASVQRLSQLAVNSTAHRDDCQSPAASEAACSAPTSGVAMPGVVGWPSERVLELEQQFPHGAEVAACCPVVCGVELCSAKDVPASKHTSSL